MNDGNAKQQIVDRIKSVTNILVTLGKNPSVDELSAALGLTLMLNKLDKHATAVFSGNIPPAIQFLEPDKTFENTVDSLRDFIIALDKEKADRLRYRVEDDVVRIFITPYRTRITEEDLRFTHGDFNVELVLALGVEKQEDLDEAIAAHGKILHDATVATLSTGAKKSSLGSIDWQDAAASSLCEMLVAMSESLKSNLLDEQIATAYLTGIVAATDRFSNSQTSPKSMTMAAQLMAAGANQQLIAAKLEESSEISSSTPAPDGSVTLSEGASQNLREPAANPEPLSEIKSPKKDDSLGQMKVDHTPPPADPQPPEPALAPTPESPPISSPAPPQTPPETSSLPQVPHATIEEHEKRIRKIAGEQALDEALAELGGAPAAPAVAPNVHGELAKNNQTYLNSDPALSYIETGDELIGAAKPTGTWSGAGVKEPSIGGTLSATTQEAEETHRHEEEDSRNKVIMSHGAPHPSEGKTITTPASPAAPSSDSTVPASDHAATISEIESKVKDLTASNGDHPDALRKEIDTIFGDSPTAPPVLAAEPSLLPPPPPLPDFTGLPLPPTTPAAAPPAPFTPQTPSPAAAPAIAGRPNSNDPGQFKIPGQ